MHLSDYTMDIHIIASRSEECLDRYIPSPTPQLEAQSTAAPTTTPVSPLHNHSRQSTNQEPMKRNASHSTHHPVRQQSEFVAGNCPVPPQSSSTVTSICSQPTVEVTSFSDSKAQGSTSHEEETVDQSKGMIIMSILVKFTIKIIIFL